MLKFLIIKFEKSMYNVLIEAKCTKCREKKGPVCVIKQTHKEAWNFARSWEEKIFLPHCPKCDSPMKIYTHITKAQENAGKDSQIGKFATNLKTRNEKRQKAGLTPTLGF